MEWFRTAVEDCTKEMKVAYAKAKENFEKAESVKQKKKYAAEMEKYDYTDEWRWNKFFYNRSLEDVIIVGTPHTFGWGGIHGATAKPIHATGLILHVDVGSYYPSMLIAWDLVTRAASKPEQYKNVYDTRMELKRAKKKKEQAPYKKLLNALSGAMKDKTNPAYDARNNNYPGHFAPF